MLLNINKWLKLTQYNQLPVQPVDHYRLHKMPQAEQNTQKLLPIDEQAAAPATDRIYYQAFLYFTICNWSGIIFIVIRLLVTPFMLIMNVSTGFNIFLIFLIAISVLQIAYSGTIIVISRNAAQYYNIADKTGHLAHVPHNELTPTPYFESYRTVINYDLTDTQAQDDEQKMKDLSAQIKRIIHQYNAVTHKIYRIQFVAYQAIHLWALILLIFCEFQNEMCENFISIVFVLGTYQYFQFYVRLSFYIIILPFYALIQLFTYCLNQYKAYKLKRSLRRQPYRKSIKGDHECKICLSPFEQTDSIIILKCNELHNFHASCLIQWSQTSFTCPLCRLDLTTN